MLKEKLSYRETARRFEVSSDTRIKEWERIYFTEGPDTVLTKVKWEKLRRIC